MVEIACITVGLILVGSGFGLFRLRIPEWSDDSMHEDSRRSIARWTKFQRILRIANNCLLIVIGSLVISAAFIPRGKMWMLLWCFILTLVMLCILLAMLDALSSLASYRNALPEVARRSFSENDDS